MTRVQSADLPAATALFRSIYVLAAALRTRMDARLATVGLTTQQAAVLTVAQRCATPPTQGEVAAVLGTSHQNVRQLLDGLERKGLVVVEVDALDRRSRRVRVTDAVEPLFAERDAADHAALRGWLGGLDDDELNQAVALLQKALAKLDPREGT
jgi:DNA-binding MarR family transcriptional regulator